MTSDLEIPKNLRNFSEIMYLFRNISSAEAITNLKNAIFPVILQP